MDAYTSVHVILSLIGILSGLLVVGSMMAGWRLGGWTELFLATAIATSATGFGFPFQRVLPFHVLGVMGLFRFRDETPHRV
jgi:hypothetical protein